MMLGIVQDDKRFLIKRGLMVGLKSFESSVLFNSLEDEVIGVIAEDGPVTVVHVLNILVKTRGKSVEPGIRNILSSNENIVKVDRNKYDLLCRVFNSKEVYKEFLLKIKIILLGGPQSLQSIWFKLSQLKAVKIELYTLSSILNSSKYFKFKNNIYRNNGVDAQLMSYDEIIQGALKEGIEVDEIRGMLKWSVDSAELLKYFNMDYRVICRSPEETESHRGELSNILDEFKF